MKYLSGDFVAEYNRVMDEYSKEQKSLEEKFEKRIDEVVQREIARLEQVFPFPFQPGEKVVMQDGAVGKVVDCPVSLNFREDEDYHGPKCGPNKFFKIRNQNDEDVLTCEGLIRIVKVELDNVTQLEMDWGINSKQIECWPDELESVD